MDPNIDASIIYYAGSLVGYIENGTIIDCYSVGGNILGGSFIGGLVEEDSSGTYLKSFWDNTVNRGFTGIGNGSDPDVIAKLTPQMKTESTYTDAGWDFLEETANGTSDFWRMCADAVSYPLLSWDFNETDLDCPDRVDFIDFAVLSLAWYSQPGDGNWNPEPDL